MRVICFLRESLLKLEKVSERDSIKTDVPESLKHDLRTVFCILRYSRENPLPILDYCGMPVLTATRVWTDASGHIKASPSIGIFVPGSSKESPLVVALAFPRFFLHAVDDQGKRAHCKTTALECLGPLASLCLDPMRFFGKEVVFHIDNMASVTSIGKGHSKDPWASCIADDLAHNLAASLDDHEVQAYISKSAVAFPLPILDWMASPSKDSSLGRKCVMWLRRQFLERIQVNS